MSQRQPNQRKASPWTLFALVALILTCAGSVSLTLAYRGQLIDLKNVIYSRCQQRQAYDLSQHLSIGADVKSLTFQLEQAREQRPEVKTLIRSFPPAQRPVLRTQERAALAAMREDLASKQRAFDVGVIGSCNSFKK